MLTDMCCSTTRFTADADSANNDNCLAELSFLIFNGVVSSALLLLFNQSFALNLFFASLTRSRWMRSLASLDTPFHSR